MAINDTFSYPTYYKDVGDEKKLKINKQIEVNFLSTIDFNNIDPYFPNLTQQILFQNNITCLINHFHLSELESFILSSAREYLDYCGWNYDEVKIEDSWSTFCTKNHVVKPHNHGYGTEHKQISGSYYVNSLEGDDGGRLHLAAPYEPKTETVFPFGDKCPSNWAYNCPPGRIILFPAWMTHWVSQIYIDNYIRISIAFDITATNIRNEKET